MTKPDFLAPAKSERAGTQPVDCTPLPNGFGCELSLPSLSSLLNQQAAAQLRRLLTIHGLLVIRAVPLTPREQVDFSRGFGDVEVLPLQDSQLPDHPQIFRVSNRPTHGLTEVGRSWHSDGAYLTHPREISIFHIVDVPDSGGETDFCSLHRAYDAASPSLIARLANKRAIFETGVTQPLIRRHPVTGQLGFYVCLGRSRRMVAVPEDEANSLFCSIEQSVAQEGGMYRHRWYSGDVVVADNFSVAHRSQPTPPNCLRVLHRTTIVGGKRLAS
jgi:taurine dioxygenase